MHVAIQLVVIAPSKSVVHVYSYIATVSFQLVHTITPPSWMTASVKRKYSIYKIIVYNLGLCDNGKSSQHVWFLDFCMLF